ncbi:MAG: hypothetical protein IKO77_03010 [Bacteroidales bacterium]|nr:hypothetical protein [Bacteroidales bacterium]
MAEVTLSDIVSLLLEKKRDEAHSRLLDFLRTHPDDAEAWLMLGNLYRSHHMWREAIDAFNHAKLLNPAGPADASIEGILEILHSLPGESY